MRKLGFLMLSRRGVPDQPHPLLDKGAPMADHDTPALMREATRRVERELIGAMLVQVTTGESAEIPRSNAFRFINQGPIDPSVKSATIRYVRGKWGSVEESAESVYGVLQNDLLRIELSLPQAVERIRESGYDGPLVFCELEQPLNAATLPNPHYRFIPKVGSEEFIFMDAVTGRVTKPENLKKTGGR